MTKKIFIDNDRVEFLRRADLHAEHPTDIKAKPEKMNHVAPRNPATHISIRLPLEVCDWVLSLYPTEPTFSAAVQRYIKEKYGSRSEAGSV